MVSGSLLGSLLGTVIGGVALMSRWKMVIGVLQLIDEIVGIAETITISVSDTAYHIGVHYFEDDGGADVEATVMVYLNGEPHETLSTTLVHNYFWRVGYTAIEDGLGAFVPSDDAPFFSTNRECSE